MRSGVNLPWLITPKYSSLGEGLAPYSHSTMSVPPDGLTHSRAHQADIPDFPGTSRVT